MPQLSVQFVRQVWQPVPSVAIGDDGNPVISHYDATNDDLELYVCANAACSSGTNETLVPAGDVGNYTSVAIGDDGNPVISHHDSTGDDLGFARVYFSATGIAYE